MDICEAKLLGPAMQLPKVVQPPPLRQANDNVSARFDHRRNKPTIAQHELLPTVACPKPWELVLHSPHNRLAGLRRMVG